MLTVLQDIRFALRHFGRAPAVTTVIVATLALVIGVNAALLGILQGLTLRPPPAVTDNPLLMRLRTEEIRADGAVRRRLASPVELAAYRARLDAFARVEGWMREDVTVHYRGRPESAPVEFVTGGYFDAVGVRPLIGSLPRRESEQASNVTAVASHGFWMALGATNEVVGKVVRVNDVPITIVAVLPVDFAGVDARGSTPSDDPILWLPVGALRVVTALGIGPAALADEELFSLIAVRHDGVTLAQANVIATTVAARHHRGANASPGTTYSAAALPLRPDNADPRMQKQLMQLAAAVGIVTLLVLLVGCTNVSTLLLIRAVARRREIGVRLAMGATRVRVVRQLLVESFVLSFAAAGLGFFVVHAIVGVAAARLHGLNFRVDAWLLIPLLVTALLTAILAGLTPAMHGTRQQLGQLLRPGSRSFTPFEGRLQRGFVIAQVAMTVPLLVGLVAFLWFTTTGMFRDHNAAQRERILSVTVDAYSGTSHRGNATQLQDVLAERITALPGVRNAATFEVPAGSSKDNVTVHPADRTLDRDHVLPVRVLRVSAGYFDVLELPFLRGHDFGPTIGDSTVTPIVVSAATARVLWGDVDALGRRLISGRRKTAFVVIGVIGGAPETHQYRDHTLVYASNAGRRDALMARVLVSTTGPAEAIAPTVRALVKVLDARLPEPMLITLAERDRRARDNLVNAATVSTGAAVALLLLAGIGLYSAVAFGVRARSSEIAVRLAIGAEPSDVIRMFFMNGLKLGIFGVILGLPLGLLVLRGVVVMSNVPLANPVLAMLGAAATVVAVACIASWVPARQAASISIATETRTD